MLALVFSERAEDDLLRVADHELQFGADHAFGVLDELEAALGLLRMFPGMAHPSESSTGRRDLDIWHVARWAIVFIVVDDQLRVVRIVPSRADLFSIDW